MKDRFGHPAAPPLRLQPELRCSDLDLSYMSVDSSKNTFSIKGVKAIGKVRSDQHSEGYELSVKLPGLQNDEQTMRISLLPGDPHSLHVKSEAAQLEVENGNPAIFDVEIHDQAGNITANPKQSVNCQVEGLPRTTTDCSSTGAGRLVTQPINLKITNGEPRTLKVTFEMPHLKKVARCSAELKVSPSRRVSVMRLYCDAGDGQLALQNNERLERRAGGALGNLRYRLYDESGREAALTAETASAMMVNWTSDVDRAGLVQGRLPDVPVPTQVMEERFCQVSYQHQNVSFTFTIVPCPDDPKQLKATLPQGTVKLGEILPGHIVVELVDQFDNVTQKFTPDCAELMTLEAEGLHKSGVTYTWQSASVWVAGVRFDSGPLGARDLCFHCGRYEGSSSLRVTPGVPAQLRLISGPEQPLQVLNGRGIPTPFLVQLFDDWGNPSPDQEALVEITPSSPTLQVTTNVISQPADAEGKASFKVNFVSGPKGYYQLEFRSSLNSIPISSTSVNLTVIADPTKPVGLSLEYDPSAQFPAGGIFPAFSLVVVSDEGSPVTTFSPTAVAMFVKREEPSTQTVTELKCSKPMENDKPDRFYFRYQARDKKIPERIGKYIVDFSLSVDQTNVLRSEQICVDVVANRPVQLAPDSPPAPPVVSHSGDVSGRTLVKSMTLQIQDAFGNPTGQDLSGTVVVCIKRPDPGRDIPLFERKMDRVSVSLDKGRAHILGLAIMENSPGENDSQYVLLFQPEVPMVSLSPYELPFHFYYDSENLGKVTRLNKNKEELRNTLAQYEKLMSSHEALTKLLTCQVTSTNQKEVALSKELVRRNMGIVGPLSTPDIDKLLQEKKTQAENLQKETRVSSIPNIFSGPDVLGKVAHLAVVEDDEAARVVSWHLRGDMDCVVTTTTEAAHRIHRDTRGNQQVLPLDGVLEADDRPLPHLRNSFSLFDPPGNPVHARKLLIYPNEQEKCNKCEFSSLALNLLLALWLPRGLWVFKNLLGETILMDDLDSATRYRRMLVERGIRCPTILTRHGDMVSAKGKFGGRQNRAPPPDGRAFGAPLPQPFHTLKKDMELLAQYREAITKARMAEKDLDDHAQKGQAPEMQRKREKQEELKKQLDEIDRELAFLSMRSGKRVPESAGEPSGISPKKPRRT
ncbi:unnamed protein product [Menidia menidia]|uniref:(Atlantic silverside) hypothetical protein n=1 Tax=Menidia menidia TaxID=238744 RepID=A0A8S4AEL0_9TELE|nr:unnamed protein product [Menidia menidia]